MKINDLVEIVGIQPYGTKYCQVVDMNEKRVCVTFPWMEMNGWRDTKLTTIKTWYNRDKIK